MITYPRMQKVLCKNCRHPIPEHGPKGACLFDSTSFRSMFDLQVALAKDINEAALERVALEKQYGQVWDTAQLRSDFRIHFFTAPFVRVSRLRGGAYGELLFQHWPRYYFWCPTLGSYFTYAAPS